MECKPLRLSPLKDTIRAGLRKRGGPDGLKLDAAAAIAFYGNYAGRASRRVVPRRGLTRRLFIETAVFCVAPDGEGIARRSEATQESWDVTPDQVMTFALHLLPAAVGGISKAPQVDVRR